MNDTFDDETDDDRAWTADAAYAPGGPNPDGHLTDDRALLDDAVDPDTTAEVLHRAKMLRQEHSPEEISVMAILAKDSEDVGAQLVADISAAVLGMTHEELYGAPDFSAEKILARVQTERARLLQARVDVIDEHLRVFKNYGASLDNLQRTISMLSNEARAGREASEQLNELARFFASRFPGEVYYVTAMKAYVESVEKNLEVFRQAHEAHKSVLVAAETAIATRAF